ncbi:MAN1 [Auxenochlorella protothecoides x Auxenochlorella symbiontica]
MKGHSLRRTRAWPLGHALALTRCTKRHKGAVFVTLIATSILAALLSRVALKEGPDIDVQDDLSNYTPLPDTRTPRCRTGGLCESWQLTCAIAKVSKDELEAEDCLLAQIFDPVSRAEQVREAAALAWDGYKACAWGKDLVKPLTCQSADWFDMGLTLVDGLSTLKMMGLDSRFREGLAWVASGLSLDNGRTVNVFEATIRLIGGLLSAHALATPADGAELTPALLERAVELGARLLPAFEASPSGIPFMDVNVSSGQASTSAWTHMSYLSEAATLTLEWTLLSRYSGNPVFEKHTDKVYEVLASQTAKYGGLLPYELDPATGELQGDRVTLGGRADSYYEYLLKRWIQRGKKDKTLLQWYIEAMRSVRSRLVQRTVGNLWFVSELDLTQNRTWPKMDHLACFLPGVLALGHYHGVDTRVPGATQRDHPPGMSDLRLARELARSCYEGYRNTPSGLAPEVWHWVAHMPDDNPRGMGEFSITSLDAHSLLRPETAESLYLLYKVTGDPAYQDQAWAIFRAVQRWARVRAGAHPPHGGGCEGAGEGCHEHPANYASLDNVAAAPSSQRDSQESFFLSETLKYLWLVQADAPDACAVANCTRAGPGRPSLFPLDTWVFNTEAHPLPLAGVRRVNLPQRVLKPYSPEAITAMNV